MYHDKIIIRKINYELYTCVDLYLDVPVVHLEQPYEKDDKASIVGPSSYKEHGFRMLMIWASGLNPDIPLIKELCEALSAVDKKAIAGTHKFALLLLSSSALLLPQQTSYRARVRDIRISLIQEDNGLQRD